jgi:REP element-mobilizing transposase RayT
MKKKTSLTQRRPRQLFLDKSLKVSRVFGGGLLKNSNAKSARPISTKESMHIVLRSSLAKGSLSMLRANRASKIRECVEAQAKRFQVKIYQFSNVGNHLHILVKAGHRALFKSFLRSITGLIARITLGVQRGAAKSIKFWDYRPFTRIVAWKRDFKTVFFYLIQNTYEAAGWIPYKPRTYRSTA